VPIAVENL